MKTFTFLFLFAILCTTSAKGQKTIKGSGYILTQQREVPVYNSIEVNGPLRIFATPDELRPVIIEADNNLFPYIKTEVRHDTLRMFIDREVYIAIWITIFTLQGLYLMGKLKFAHDSDLKYIGVPRLAFIIVTFAFVVYLIPGMFGAPLKALAGYLPPQETIDFDINRIVRENVRELAKSGVTAGSAVKPGEELCEEPKYADFLHLPHGLEGYFDYEQAVKCAQAQGKPLFIDFTGHGCVNCREMEQSVWSDPRVKEILRNDYVVVALYVDDKTTLPENEWYVSEYDNKKKKTLGKKNADFQIKKFDSNAQPNYILLDSRGGNDTDLKQHVLAPARGHNLDKDAFVKFLKQGLEEYKKRSK